MEKSCGQCAKLTKSDLTIRIEEKFKSLVFDTDNCIVWSGTLTHDGYAQQGFKLNGKLNGKLKQTKASKASKVSFLLFNGEIVDNLYVLHSCDNRACINPKHLFLGTHKDNMKDCTSKGRYVSNYPFAHKLSIVNSKLTDNDIKDIRDSYAKGVKGKGFEALANRYGISKTYVIAIIQDKYRRSNYE